MPVRSSAPRATSRGRHDAATHGVPTLAVWALYLSVVGCVLLEPPFRIGAGLTVADLSLAVLCVSGWSFAVNQPGQARPLTLRLLPWLWLSVLASLVALSHVGLPVWGLVTLAKNTLPFVVVLVTYGILSQSPHLCARLWSVWKWVAVVVALSILGQSATGRSSGLFSNPNYPAHYLTLTLLAVWVLDGSRWRVAGSVIFGAAIVQTGSFSPFPMVAASIIYVLWRWGARWTPAGRLAWRMLLAVAVLACFAVSLEALRTDFDAGSGLDSARLDRSSTARLDLWQISTERVIERPWGWGPGFTADADRRHVSILGGPGEAHNDVLDSLLGAGLVGAVALGMAVYRTLQEARPGGATRIIAAAWVASSVFRQTLNFRHAALLLGLLLAVDYLNAARNVPQRDEPQAHAWRTQSARWT